MTTEVKRYRLLCALYSPAESTEPDMYMAEVPAFPNCVAWGGTPDETLATLESVVVETIRTYEERGYALPPGIAPLETDAALSSMPQVLEVSV
ncbi:MAG: hypothetical protein OXL97_07165 [Chloroflexota bacterium]|nr:hypothetical protein [Chloroflexota bacterium]MDE2883951.1 hypothetical protein [Chloroflexota bacterium]